MKQPLFTTADYRSLSLVELGLRVVQNSDPTALEEILSRPLFHSKEKPRLRLPEYLDSLRTFFIDRNRQTVRANETADKAYDIALDKFSNMPASSAVDDLSPPPVHREMKRTGSDCRLYWKAFIKHISEEFGKKSPKGQLEKEIRAAASLQRFIRWHFYLSLLDAERRTNKFWSRYNWLIGKQSIIVWLPKYLKGKERRTWLEKNIKDPDPSRSGERERIQNIIGRRLVNMGLVPFQDNIGRDPTASIINKISGQMDFGFSLARFVADEKSAEIENQRRSIKKLGNEKIKNLVLRIFEDLETDSFQDQQIANDFGLSKATFSRFAGSQWCSSKSKAIPDLWQNTAQVLAKHPVFKEAAIEVGVWKDVEETLNNTTRN